MTDRPQMIASLSEFLIRASKRAAPMPPHRLADLESRPRLGDIGHFGTDIRGDSVNLSYRQFNTFASSFVSAVLDLSLWLPPV